MLLHSDVNNKPDKDLSKMVRQLLLEISLLVTFCDGSKSTVIHEGRKQPTCKLITAVFTLPVTASMDQNVFSTMRLLIAPGLVAAKLNATAPPRDLPNTTICSEHP